MLFQQLPVNVACYVDVREKVPECSGIPHHGETVWAEKECLSHHYKFVLALENSQDCDYVTEKLYQVSTSPPAQCNRT
jgi:hypothetical protein